nr:Chain A, FGAILSS (residues 23-29) from islet amyloid polypeptide [Homo sapiens]5E61_B Chain B, FGAILSS (residues 23-29) from islet amyloid polypeptide [Homo sapiens]
FGAILSS